MVVTVQSTKHTLRCRDFSQQSWNHGRRGSTAIAAGELLEVRVVWLVFARKILNERLTDFTICVCVAI
jgi:hypothetical protein